MLVLSRKVGERIVIGDQIRITVVRLQGGTVRLGIEAPQSTTILRAELHAEPPAEDRERSMRVA